MISFGRAATILRFSILMPRGPLMRGKRISIVYKGRPPFQGFKDKKKVKNKKRDLYGTGSG